MGVGTLEPKKTDIFLAGYFGCKRLSDPQISRNIATSTKLEDNSDMISPSQRLKKLSF